MYSLLFLSSFRFWGVFHKWSLRPPPLADLALPYLLFFMCDFPSSFFYCLTKNNFEKKNSCEKNPRPPYNGSPSFSGPDLPLSPPAVRPKEATSETTWTVRTDLTSKGSFPLNRRLSLTIISLLAAGYGNVCFLEPNRFRTISVEFCLSLAVGFR
jgi:hypothetical protein